MPNELAGISLVLLPPQMPAGVTNNKFALTIVYKINLQKGKSAHWAAPPAEFHIQIKKRIKSAQTTTQKEQNMKRVCRSEIGAKVAPFYPPVIYQKQADVKICDFKFLADSAEIGSKVLPLILAKKILPSVETDSAKDDDSELKMLPCTVENLASQHKQIKSIEIPTGWVQYEGNSKGFAFHPDGKEDVIFAIYCDGSHVPGSEQHTMKNVLRQPPHELTWQERHEFWDLFPQNKARRDFTFNLTKTVVWNGRKVIETEGEWPNDEEYSHKAGTTEYCIIYDLFGNGEMAGQIYLRASKEEYPKYIDRATECMKSIRWTSNR